MRKTQGDRARALLNREGATSLMSYTKWKKTLTALQYLPLRYRAKMLLWDEVAEWGRLFYGNIPDNYVEMERAGPVTLLEIEWLEIHTIEEQHRGVLVDPLKIDHTNEIQSILTEFKVPSTLEGDVIRIHGHLRKVG